MSSTKPNPVKIKDGKAYLEIKFRQEKHQLILDEIDYKKVKNFRFLNLTQSTIGTRSILTENNTAVNISDLIVHHKDGYYLLHKNGNLYDFTRKNLVHVQQGLTLDTYKLQKPLKLHFVKSLKDTLFHVRETSSRKQPSPYVIEGNKIKITLLNMQSKLLGYAYVSIEDENKIKNKRWSLSKYFGYPYTSDTMGNHLLHKVILGSKNGYVIDHINRNKLDNTRENLRFVLPSLNARNQNIKTESKIRCIVKSPFKGYAIKLHLSNGMYFYLRAKSLMSAIGIKNFLLEYYNDTIHERDNIQEYANKFNQTPVIIKNFYDITRNIYCRHDSKTGIFGVTTQLHHSKKYNFLICKICTKSFDKDLRIVKYAVDTPENRVMCAYLYNKAIKLFMKVHSEFKPLNPIKDICKQYNITKEHFLRLKETWKLDSSVIDTIHNMKRIPKIQYDLIKLDNEKILKVYTNYNKSFFLVDQADFDKVAYIGWNKNKDGYFKDITGRKLHRVIMNLTPNNKEVVNHKNHIRWDNRRKNLEIVPVQVNCSNTISKEKFLKLEKELLDKINIAKFIKE